MVDRTTHYTTADLSPRWGGDAAHLHLVFKRRSVQALAAW